MDRGRGMSRGGRGMPSRGRGMAPRGRGGPPRGGGRGGSARGRGAARGSRGGRGGAKAGAKGGSKVIIEPHRFEGVYVARGKEDMLCTKNLVPGESVYGEKRISVDNADGTKTEYR